jgi:DNA-binding IclR family transcriptional regulator
MIPTRGPAGVQVLHKTTDVLDALSSALEGLSLAQLAARVGIPKPTVYRILATFEGARVFRKSGVDGGEVLVIETWRARRQCG